MTTATKAPTLNQRAITATAHLREVLQLDDIKVLSVAVAEVAADEAENNARFAERIRAVYQELLASRKTQPLRQKRGNPDIATVPLIPIAGVSDDDIDPFAPLSAYRLLRTYGPHQLRQALSVYSMTTLKQALAEVLERNSGTKPQNRSRKDSVIDYIVEQVAGPGY